MVHSLQVILPLQTLLPPRSTITISTPARPYHPPYRPTTREYVQRIMEGAEKSGKESPPLQSDTFDTPCRLRSRQLTGRSFQDALRSFFQPIKTDDALVDFYTMYKREATEYDTDYIKKYDENLNITLIFVRRSSFVLVNHLICRCRRACSLPSALFSSLMSIRASNQIPTNNPQPSSVPSSSLSTSPPSPVRLLPFHMFRDIC